MNGGPPATTPLLTDITSLVCLLSRALPERDEHRELLTMCDDALRFLARHLPPDELASEATVIRDLLLDIAARTRNPIA